MAHNCHGNKKHFTGKPNSSRQKQLLQVFGNRISLINGSLKHKWVTTNTLVGQTYRLLQRWITGNLSLFDSNASINSKIQPPPPLFFGQPSNHLNLWRLVWTNSRPRGEITQALDFMVIFVVKTWLVSGTFLWTISTEPSAREVIFSFLNTSMLKVKYVYSAGKT